MNSINASNYFSIANEIKNNGNTFNEMSNSFSNMGAMCIINIIVSLIFCLAITIAYERSQSNKQKIENISDYLESKNKVKHLEKHDKNNEKSLEDNWIIKTDDSVKSNSNIEEDDNADNIAKENECPVCFSHINPHDKQCPNCGAKLKK